VRKILPREHDRVTHLRQVTFRVASGGPTLRGHTIDLSRSGVRLFCDRALSVGDTIDLTWSDREPPVTISGRVVYLKVEVEGNSAGVRFHHPINPVVYQFLRGTRQRPRAAERGGR
jgi:hypothetical protein